jgi:hypothetical protein
MDKVAAIGCIICKLYEGVYSPAAIHHIDGKTKPGCHFHVLPLCGNHHQVPDTQKPQRWISRHGNGLKAFEAAYMTEQELLHLVLRQISAL